MRAFVMLTFGWWLLVMVPGVGAAAPDAPARDFTELWGDYDPRALPLEIEVRREWSENGIRFQRIYFTGEICQGEPVRVFAITGVPENAKAVPGMLHIHGGGQTASEPWIRFWTRRGYAAVSLDWYGRHPDRTDFTQWGKAGADMADSQAHTTTPSVRFSPWYHWALVSRRALTVLENLPGVDPQRLGEFGISVGGYLTWPVAGSDGRLRAAAALYGCGWNTYPDVHSGGGYHHPVPPEVDLWRATMEPETCARYIQCPLLLLSATNDFHTPIDRTWDSLARVPALTRMSLTPRYNHHLEPPQGRTLAAWMDWHLKGATSWPASPRLDLSVKDGALAAVVTADLPDAVERVELFYSLGDKRSQTRFWRSAPVTRDGPRWSGRLALPDREHTVRAFANVTWNAGCCLTSAFASLSPSALTDVDVTQSRSPVLDDFSGGIDAWTWTPAYTDPHLDWSYLEPAAGPDGSGALTFNPMAFGSGPIRFHFGTHKVGDPLWVARPGAALSFQVHAPAEATLELQVAVDEWGPKSRRYTAKVSLAEGRDWQTLVVRPEQCLDPAGTPLADFGMIDRLELVGTAPAGKLPRFAQFMWVESGP